MTKETQKKGFVRIAKDLFEDEEYWAIRDKEEAEEGLHSMEQQQLESIAQYGEQSNY